MSAFSPFANLAARARWWARVDKGDGTGCWVKGNHRGGARVALAEALQRRLTPGECALHSCDNPPCVRVHPDHVHLGSQSDNMREMLERGHYNGDKRSDAIRRGWLVRKSSGKTWTRPDNVAKNKARAGTQYPSAVRVRMSEGQRRSWLPDGARRRKP